MVENKFTPIKIKLIKEEAKERDKTGDIVVSKTKRPDPQTGKITEEINYARNDLVGLMALLGRFDSRKHAIKDWKMSVKIRDKMRNAYLKDFEEIELTLDEATFLKLYLKELPEKDGQEHALPEFELRTLFGITDQLEGGKE